MKGKIIYLSAEAIAEFKAELKELQVSRKQIANELRASSAQGDLRENLSMQIAEEKYRYSEDRIAELEKLLASARPLVARPGRTARLGCYLTLSTGQAETELRLVLPVEANPALSRISIDSPLGKKLLGKHVSDTVTMRVGRSATSYKIIKIS